VTEEEIMKEDGFVTAADAARAVGASQVGTIHRAIEGGRLLGTKIVRRWYVSVAALLDQYKNVKPILERVKALGVKPNPEHDKIIKAKKERSRER